MRNQETTKHDYGHALLIAGSYGKMGCAILAARAALRSGCGLLTVHLPQRCVDPMQSAFPEAMVSIDPGTAWCAVGSSDNLPVRPNDPVRNDIFTTPPEHLDRYTAIAVGPGIGTAPATCQALHALLSNLSPSTSHLSPFTTHLSPSLILDADALNILAKEIPHSSFLIQHSILTPHAREYHRLFGDADPAEMARLHNIIIVKKAHHTRVYSPDGQVYENRTGNAGMATAGSGDVLTGILLGMLCSNHLHANVYNIVCRAVELHGKLGDLALANQSESSLIASDMVENLKHISTDITEC